MRPDQDWDNPPGVLTAMAPSDRHEIVILTSAFHGFIKGLADDGKLDRPLDLRPGAGVRRRGDPVGAGRLAALAGQWRPPTPWRSAGREVLEPVQQRFDRHRRRRPGAPARRPRRRTAGPGRAQARVDIGSTCCARSRTSTGSRTLGLLGETGRLPERLGVGASRHPGTRPLRAHRLRGLRPLPAAPRRADQGDRAQDPRRRRRQADRLPRAAHVRRHPPAADGLQRRDGQRPRLRAAHAAAAHPPHHAHHARHRPARADRRRAELPHHRGQASRSASTPSARTRSGQPVDFTTTLVFVPFSDVKQPAVVDTVRSCAAQGRRGPDLPGTGPADDLRPRRCRPPPPTTPRWSPTSCTSRPRTTAPATATRSGRSCSKPRSACRPSSSCSAATRRPRSPTTPAS